MTKKKPANRVMQVTATMTGYGCSDLVLITAQNKSGAVWPLAVAKAGADIVLPEQVQLVWITPMYEDEKSKGVYRPAMWVE